jgi:hypothetical protein
VSATFLDDVKSRTPALLLSGELDPVTPPALGARVARDLPRSRQVVLQGLSHTIASECADHLASEFIVHGAADSLDASCAAQTRRPPFLTPESLAAARQPAPSPSTLSSEERWLGTLEVSGRKLRLLLKIHRGAGGALTARLDSLDQPGSENLPVDTIRFEVGVLQFEMKLIGASYEGRANAAGEIAGTWTQSGRSWPLVFRRDSQK